MEKIKEAIKSGKFTNLVNFHGNIPLPLNPEISVSGVKPDIYIFKSAMVPIKVDFENDKDPYSVIFYFYFIYFYYYYYLFFIIIIYY